MRTPGDWPVRAGLGAALVAGSWWAVQQAAGQRLDVRLGEWLRRTEGPCLDRLIATTTEVGSFYAVLGVAAGLGALRRRAAAADALGVGLIAWGVSQAAKTRVGRVRPYEADGVRRLVDIPTGSSFPSGHAAVSVAVTTVLADRARPSAGRVGLRLLSAYVPATRVYVGVHYPTDVLGGAGLGLLLGSVWRGAVAAGGRGVIDLREAGAARLLRPLGRGGAPRS